MARLTGTGIHDGALRFGDPAQAAERAAELEELGYSALWLGDLGGDLFGAMANLLLPTSRITVATGFNKWGMTNGTAAGLELAEQLLADGASAPTPVGRSMRLPRPDTAFAMVRTNPAAGAASVPVPL